MICKKKKTLTPPIRRRSVSRGVLLIFTVITVTLPQRPRYFCGFDFVLRQSEALKLSDTFFPHCCRRTVASDTQWRQTSSSRRSGRSPPGSTICSTPQAFVFIYVVLSLNHKPCRVLSDVSPAAPLYYCTLQNPLVLTPQHYISRVAHTTTVRSLTLLWSFF